MRTRKSVEKFPLWFHPEGQWCKKFRGRNFYFGTDKDEAIKRYAAEWDDIKAGRPPRPRAGVVTVADLVNHFLTTKRERLQTGELSQRAWADYYSVAEALIEGFGPLRPVTDLRPDDFAKLRAKAAKRLGPVALGVYIQRTRTILKHGYDAELLSVPVRVGPAFAKPSRKTIRLARADRGTRMIDAATVRALIDGAGSPLDAMVLLAINCGFGQTDIAELPRSALTRSGWIDFRRPKTGSPRRCPLWPETVEAIQRATATRPNPIDPQHDRLVFLTRYGRPFVRHTEPSGEKKHGCRIDSLSQEYGKLTDRLKVKVQGFYSLRHVHRTVADEVLDPVAAGLIMGHVEEGIAATYREHVADDRLQSVVDHVRDWLIK